jgi:hypothetical protein
MYICPICNSQFNSEDELVKDMMKCWRDKNPSHQSKPAPRSEDVNTREINSDIVDFLNSFN